MLFRVCEHYNDNIIFKDKNNNKNNNKIIRECFICFENDFEYGKIICLNNQKLYLSNCKCNGYIHENCLDVWIEKSNKCPICRIFVDKISVHIKNNSLYVFFYLYGGYAFKTTKLIIIIICKLAGLIFIYSFLSVFIKVCVLSLSFEKKDENFDNPL
jgi:hypothetical protein